MTQFERTEFVVIIEAPKLQHGFERPYTNRDHEENLEGLILDACGFSKNVRVKAQLKKCNDIDVLSLPDHGEEFR